MSRVIASSFDCDENQLKKLFSICTKCDNVKVQVKTSGEERVAIVDFEFPYQV